MALPGKHTPFGELCLNIGDGQAIITKDDKIEFHDCLPISIPDLEYVIAEAKRFISYRNYRAVDNLFDEFPEIPESPYAEKSPVKPVFDQLFNEFPDQETPHISRLAELVADVDASKHQNDVTLVSTWNMKCGIATYTGYLYDAIKKIDSKFPLNIHPISQGIDYMGPGIVHFQHEFGIMPRVPRAQGKVIVTFHTVPENMGSILEAYEKTLNVVAYVAHFQEAKDIISASTKKDVWMIPHGSRIIPQVNILDTIRGEMQEYTRSLLELPQDEPCAFMFGFQSDNKNYTMVTQACEKAGVKLIISGAVNDHANYKGNVGCGRDNVIVLGRYLSELEVDLYALASDILLFQTNQLDHYSCSGALHRVIGAGRPVICNRVRHYSDLVEGEDCLKYGRLNPADMPDEQELVQKIAQALEKKEEYSRKALEFAERTSWEIVARKHMELYQKYG